MHISILLGIVNATAVKEEVTKETEVKQDIESEDEWIEEDDVEGELSFSQLNPVNLEEKCDAIPAETPTGSTEVLVEENVLNERPIAGIPPAQYRTPRPKRGRRVPLRYRW